MPFSEDGLSSRRFLLNTTCQVLSACQLMATGADDPRLCPNDFDVAAAAPRVMLMLSMSDFKKLQVWQKAHALSLAVDRMSTQMRGTRYRSLRSQIFRAAMSIPANIAEGRRQKSEKEFARFLGYALNSSSELEYHLIVGRDTRGIPESEFVCLVTQTITVRKMLYGLLKRLATPESVLPNRVAARSH